MCEFELNDISENLIIINKNTIETLIHLEKASDCIALYILYYRLAKWQKTNKIKAIDSYVCKILNWGKDKTTKIKRILKEQGLIEIIQNRKNGKINGWFVKINYIVSDKNIDNMNFKIDDLSVTENSVTDFTTSCSQETIALKNNINCLNKKIQLLNNENDLLKKKILKLTEEENFDDNLYKEIIDYMNMVYEHHSFKIKQPFFYKATSKDTQKYINARLKDGYGIEDFKDVIWWGYRKFVEFCFETQNKESSVKYFRPSTLFSERHFEEYLNEYRANTQ